MRSLARMGVVRGYADGLMTDTLTAYSPGPPTTDADGMEAPAWVEQGSTPGRVHAGIRLQSVTSETASVGGVERPVLGSGLRIPISAPVPAVGWEYVLTATGPQSDASLVGRRWHVVGVQADSFATARRLDVVEVPA